MILEQQDFDTDPPISTFSLGTSLKFRGFLLLWRALMSFGGGAPANFARENVLDGKG